MIQALAIPLPLADGDDVAKIVIGVVFALIWIIAQAVSSIGAKKRADIARRPRDAVQTIADVHASLYRTGRKDDVDFAAYEAATHHRVPPADFGPLAGEP